MERYGEFCPVSLAAEVFARRWTPLIVRELLQGSTRFNDLRRGIPNISSSMLSRRLHELAAAGIVQQSQQAGEQRYLLTQAGRELLPVVEQLGVWGRRWLPSQYREEDLDPRLLVWDIHRKVRLDAITRRIVLQVYFPDAPEQRRAYWLVLQPHGADVCLTDPGGGVDARIVSDVRTLTDVWMGNSSWAQALSGGRLQITGDGQVCRDLPSWLELSPFAQIPPASAEASQ